MPTNVLLVNGPPQAGKDSLVASLSEHYAKRGHHVAAFSSIDPVREMLAHVGIDVTKKTEADRKLLALIGNLIEEHSHFRTNYCFDKIVLIDRLFSRKSPVIFLHMREHALIDKLENQLKFVDIRLWRIFVESPRAEKTFSNSADANVFQMKRNFTVKNEGTLEDLDRKAAALVDLTCMRKEFSHVA